MSDFTGPSGPKKGRLTNFRTGDFLEFLYNPTSYKEKAGANHAEDTIPGSSDVLLRWMSGKARTLQFSLSLCGESRLRFSKVNLINQARGDSIDRATRFGVEGEIEFFESFSYPVDPADGGDGGCDKVVFTFGRRHQGTLCVLDEIEIEPTEFTPELDISRATVSFSLKRYTTKTTYSNKIFAPFGR